MLFYIAIFVVVVCVSYIFSQWVQSGKDLITVLVLGDMGHSPRMQNHVSCLASIGLKVDFIGYLESALPSHIDTSPLVRVIHITPLPKLINKLPRTLRYLAKFAFQTFQLTFVLLCTVSKSRCLLLQSPPAIPTLLVASLTGLIRGTEVCVDWHNYGYTLMGLQLGQDHSIVRVARVYEKLFARLSHYNFCVTKGMRDDLSLFWNVAAVVLYDKPNPKRFRGRVTAQQAHELFSSLADTHRAFEGVDETETKLTKEEKGIYKFKTNRPLLLVSSTSWTEDEDFGILLEALDLYETARRTYSGLPDIFCVITGKGALREYYEKEIAKRNFLSVEVVTVWLAVEDYPTILGAADIGVSLHTSSSGLDLPMKVVDMFGSDLPVLAREFRCIGELVQDSKNGFLFSTSDELCDKLVQLAGGFPRDIGLLDKFQREIRVNRTTETWQNEWDREARPYFSRRSKPIGLYVTRLIILLLSVCSVIQVFRLIGLNYLLNALLAD